MAFRCLVGRVLGVVLVMLVARAWARESGCTLLGKRNGASVEETGRGADSQTICVPPLVFARVFTCALSVFICGGA